MRVAQPKCRCSAVLGQLRRCSKSTGPRQVTSGTNMGPTWPTVVSPCKVFRLWNLGPVLRQLSLCINLRARKRYPQCSGYHPSTARGTTKATWCGKTRKEEGRGRGRGRGILRKKLVKLMRDSQSVSRVFATCPVAILSRFAWFCMCLRRPEGWLGVRGESIAGMRSRGIIKYVMKAWGHERYRERVCEYLKFWRGVMRAR